MKEQESNDKTIGSIDSFEIASDFDEDPDRCYKILRINPEASLAEIHEAFEKMNAAWHPDRYPHVISWEDKSKKKLKEIRNAYEKLVRLYPHREQASQRQEPSPILLATTVERHESSDQERSLPILTASPSSSLSSSIDDLSSWSTPASSSTTFGPSGNLLRRIIVIGLPTLIVLFFAFLWPSLYHYAAINLGGKEYPLRINRITSHTTYYNGNQWIVPPVQNEPRQEIAMKAPTGPSLQPVPPVQPLQSVQTSPPAQPLEPAKPEQTIKSVQPVPPRQQVQPIHPPIPANPSTDKGAIPSKPYSLSPPKVVARPAKKEAPPKEVAVKVIFAQPYSIQIIAYPEKDKAEAFAKTMRGKKMSVRIEEVAIKGKGRWHRVLLGNFKNRHDALKYFNNNKIGILYPQSFIQKSANS
ncbi:MAG: SPOR domain-containing protein [Syntrophales bacterium]